MPLRSPFFQNVRRDGDYQDETEQEHYALSDRGRRRVDTGAGEYREEIAQSAGRTERAEDDEGCVTVTKFSKM